MLEEEEANFLITGEVLGQRPMSQNRRALSVVASESGYQGLVLRPLSAKRLPLTIPETEGWVERDKLLDFSGRSRKPQMALAKSLNIKEYPSPAGGCLLTDEVFSRRLRDLLTSRPSFELPEIELLRYGRHFRVGPHLKLIIGRNKSDNQAIQSLSSDKDLLLRPVSVPGPTVLVLGDPSPEEEELIASMTVSYSDAGDNLGTEVQMIRKGVEQRRMAMGRDKKEFRRYMI
jgi:tRNA U34 2-thiouridine synthase MnmA/TrmU